jgi:hypothetical protein
MAQQMRNEMKQIITVYLKENAGYPDHVEFEGGTQEEVERLIQKAFETYTSETGECDIVEVDVRNAEEDI